MSELIAYGYHINNYNDLESLTKDIFNKVYTEDNCPVWILNAQVNDQKIFDFSSDFSIDKLRPSGPRAAILELLGIKNIAYTSSNTLIPTFNQDKIKTTLILGCLK